jgi:GGDEF domain-containing protein
MMTMNDVKRNIYLIVNLITQKVVGGYLEAELLRKMAFKDSLTETVNRRRMEAVLEEELEHHQST